MPDIPIIKDKEKLLYTFNQSSKIGALYVLNLLTSKQQKEFIKSWVGDKVFNLWHHKALIHVNNIIGLKMRIGGIIPEHPRHLHLRAAMTQQIPATGHVRP